MSQLWWLFLSACTIVYVTSTNEDEWNEVTANSLVPPTTNLWKQSGYSLSNAPCGVETVVSGSDCKTEVFEWHRLTEQARNDPSTPTQWGVQGQCTFQPLNQDVYYECDNVPGKPRCRSGMGNYMKYVCHTDSTHTSTPAPTYSTPAPTHTPAPTTFPTPSPTPAPTPAPTTFPTTASPTPAPTYACDAVLSADKKSTFCPASDLGGTCNPTVVGYACTTAYCARSSLGANEWRTSSCRSNCDDTICYATAAPTPAPTTFSPTPAVSGGVCIAEGTGYSCDCGAGHHWCIQAFSITSGPCLLETGTGCVTTSNWPSPYGPNEACSMTVNADGFVSATSFGTEESYDKLTVDGIDYSGSVGPYKQSVVGIGVAPIVSWESDSSGQGQGWRLCYESDRANARTPAPTPTSPAPTYASTPAPTPTSLIDVVTTVKQVGAHTVVVTNTFDLP